MKIRTSAAAVTVAAALGMALAPTAALAHDGGHPFKNCTAAYEAGYSNIPKGDEHYGKHLDRDGDGIGCDKPPADFVPVDERDKGDEDSTGADDSASQAPANTGGDLAETGGSSATPYVAAGGAVVLAAGAGVLVVTRKRRANH